MIQEKSRFAVNWWAILVSTIVTMVLGYLWFGPLFGESWGGLTTWTPQKIQTLSAEALGIQYGFSVVLAAVMATAMAYTLKLVGATTVLHAVLVALGIALCFVGSSVGTIYLFELQSMALFAINVGYRIVTLVATALILAVWK